MRENRGRRQIDERLITQLRLMPPEVRLVWVDESGEEVNEVMPSHAAWNRLVETDLNLVMISKDAKPPVVRLCDYGKFKFAEEKHRKELAKSNREHARTIKNLRINQNIGPADYDRSIAKIREWLPDHDVRLEVIMKGYKGMPNRMALPRGMAQDQAPKWSEFILNRVLRDLGSEVRSDRMSAGDKGISTTIRPA